MVMDTKCQTSWKVKKSGNCKSKQNSFRNFSLLKWDIGKKTLPNIISRDDFLRELIEIWVNFNFRHSFLSKHVF